MISFRPIEMREFGAYRSYFVPDYALDLIMNHGLAPAAAQRQAADDLDHACPDGQPAEGHYLMCIIGPDGALIGYLWIESLSQGQTAFVQDFHILPAMQGRGLAKAAMAALDKWALDQGFTQIKLRVAPDNAAARHVYDQSGFRVSGIQMIKPL